MQSLQTLHTETETAGACVTVRLNRPDARNAMNDAMIQELIQVFTHMPASVRVIILTGTGGAFCSGADLAMMKASARYGAAENRADATRLAGLFKQVDEAPQVVIAKVNGTAMGGALGLIAACDLVAAVDAGRFAFSEVRLGLAPAVISPFVLAKIGISQARRFFVTGELFGAAQAEAMGLVHKVVAPEALDTAVQEWVDMVLKCGPQAVAAAKTLIRQMTTLPAPAAAAYAIDTIAQLRISPEAQEGLGAFLQKRKPSWVQ